ncbi:MAG: VOC family protein [Lentisphaerae bacterium]|nr:VOC family protein [Lentisphaerota bacterium]
MIIGIAHICLSVKNLDVMEEFYVRKLGLSHAFDFKGEDGKRMGVYISIGNRTFLEMFTGRKSIEGQAENAAYRHVCLEVDDLQSTVSDIRSRGVDVSDPMLGSDNAWQAWLTDPEGNSIELHQYTAESWQAPFL